MLFWEKTWLTDNPLQENCKQSEEEQKLFIHFAPRTFTNKCKIHKHKRQNHENEIKLFFSFLESQKCSRKILKSLTKIIFLEFEKRQKIWNKKVFFLFPLQNFSKCALFFKNYISWDWSLGYTVRIDKQCCLTSPGSIRNIFPSARTW